MKFKHFSKCNLKDGELRWMSYRYEDGSLSMPTPVKILYHQYYTKLRGEILGEQRSQNIEDCYFGSIVRRPKAELIK